MNPNTIFEPFNEVPEPTEVLKQFKGLNLKKFKQLVNTKQCIKNNIHEQEFLLKMKKVLASIDKKFVEKYDENIVLFVIDTVEHIFVKRHSKEQTGDLKLQISTELLKPYFNNDVMLVEKFIQLVLPKITQSTMLSRNINKIRNFFLSVLGM